MRGVNVSTCSSDFHLCLTAAKHQTVLCLKLGQSLFRTVARTGCQRRCHGTGRRITTVTSEAMSNVNETSARARTQIDGRMDRQTGRRPRDGRTDGKTDRPSKFTPMGDGAVHDQMPQDAACCRADSLMKVPHLHTQNLNEALLARQLTRYKEWRGNEILRIRTL